MEKLLMCRICLAENVPMQVIVATYLQDIYELVTYKTLKIDNMEPAQACYICYARLKNCYQLRKDCLRSDEMLKQMLLNNTLTPAQLGAVPSNSRLSVTAVLHLSLGNVIQVEATESDVAMEAPEVLSYCEVKVEMEPEDFEEKPVSEPSPLDDAAEANDDIQPSETRMDSMKKEPKHNTAGDKELSVATQDVNSPSSSLNKEVFADVLTIDKKAETNTRTKSMVLEKCNNVGLFFFEHIDTSEKQYQCKECKVCFPNKHRLEQHAVTHTLKPYQCKTCKRYFRQRSSLHRHTRTHTGTKPYECTVCKKSFIQKGHLESHIRTHTGEKSYQCNTCEKYFTSKGNLNVHIRLHTGHKPHVCNYCDKSYISKNALNMHIRSHTGEKPYQCTVCNKCFSDKRDITKHERIHTGEKPYKCNICCKSFSDKSNLDKHVRTHTGEKPFQCHICNKSFSQRGHLGTHIRKHTNEKPHQCNICDKAFSDKRDLIIHSRKLHDG